MTFQDTHEARDATDGQILLLIRAPNVVG